MGKIDVRLGADSYSVYVGSGILKQTAFKLKELGLNDKAVIITNPVVQSLYGDNLKQHLISAGFNTIILEVPDGEEHKSLESAGKLYRQLTEFGAERTTPVLALGGGVIGDLAGFVAATYMRGMPLVQLPTTLLAQCDSSIGGKTAVNHGQLKNEIGTFYQPKITITDISTLKTLPQNEFINGLCEVIKHAMIIDEQFFDYLEKYLDLAKALDDNVLETIVTKSVQIKKEIVESDEKDTGLRNILNFGHTVGHAVEAASNFEIAHGQAVAVGLVAAAKIGMEMGTVNINTVNRLKIILRKAGLRTELPQLDINIIMHAMQHDKKIKSGKIRFILPKSIGQVFITDEVSPNIVEKVLMEMKWAK
jgi:3-dehydroquinate synthase